MFSQRERLPRAQFKAALKTNRRLSSEHFLLLFPEKANGYAVIIPKKVIRLSVGRHQLKRRITEALRALTLPPAVIVFPRASASSVNYEGTQKELSILLSKMSTSK